MRKRKARSLDRDLRKIELLQREVQEQIDCIVKLKRELTHQRGLLTWASHVLGIAGECLASRQAGETARLCRIVAGNTAPDGEAQTIMASPDPNNNKANR